MKDLKTKIKTEKVTAGTTIIDRQGFESLTFSLDVEDGTTVALTHGDDSALADSSVVAADERIGKLVFATADGSPATIGYVGDKRYVLLTISAAAPAGGDVIAIKGDPHLAPVTQA